MLDELRRALGSVEGFAKVSETFLSAIANVCIVRTAPAGVTVVTAADSSDDVFIVLSGRLHVILYSTDGRRVHLATLNVGDFFGEISALDRQHRSATVESLEDCRLAVIKAKDFETLIRLNADFAFALLKALARRVRLLSDRIFEFSTLAAQNRIQAELLRLANIVGHGCNDVWLSPAPSLAEIASRVSTHREAVSREISRLAHIGILYREARGLHIIDIARLTDLVREAKGE